MAEGQRPLNFVVVSDPEQFRNKRNQRRVRQTVMHNYLANATRDPTSTDRRITHKRRKPSLPATQVFRSEGVTASTDATSGPASVEPDTASTTASSISGAETDRASPACACSQLDQLDLCTSAWPHHYGLASLFASMRTRNLGHEHRDPSASASPDHHMTHISDFMDRMHDTKQDEKFPCLMAYRFKKEEKKHSVESCPTGSPEVDQDSLKVLCGAFYGTKAMAEQWTPLMMQTEEAYLSTLCVAAPLADLLAIQRRASGDMTPLETDNTTRVFLVVPRLINARLGRPDEALNDQTIIAIGHLLYGQLTTPNDGVVNHHKAALKYIVTARGGLRRLGSDGLIARFLTITHIEAGILRDEAVDTIYTVWADSHDHQIQPSNIPPPIGPMFDYGRMEALLNDDSCTPETLELLLLVRNIIDTICLHGSTYSPSHSTTTTTTTTTTGSLPGDVPGTCQVPALARRILAMRPKEASTCSVQAYHISESIRLAAVRFSTAVLNRLPLSADLSSADKSPSALPREEVTAEDIYQSLRRTNLESSWGNLAGVLHWVLLVAAVSCAAFGDTAHHNFPTSHPLPTLQHKSSAGRNPCPGFDSRRDSASQPSQKTNPESSNSTPSHVKQASRSAQTQQTQPALHTSPPTPTTPHLSPEPQHIRERSHRLFQEYANDVWRGRRPACASPTQAHHHHHHHHHHHCRRRLSAVQPYSANPSPDQRPSLPAPQHSIHPSSPGLEHKRRLAEYGLGTKRARHEMSTSVRGSIGGMDLDHMSSAKRRAFVKQYFTVHAVRVNILLMFEHPVAVVKGLRRMEIVTSWLRGERGDCRED